MGESRRERRALARVNRKAEKLAEASLSPRSSSGVHPLRFAGIFVGGIVLGLSIAFLFASSKKTDVAPVVVASKADSEPRLTLGRLTELPDAELAGVDIALMNLLCSEGLPGRDGTNSDAYLLKLGRMAESIRLQTARNYHKFLSNPAEFESSEEFYKVAMLNTVLGQDFGLQYNPKKIAAASVENLRDQSFFDKADDVFLSGLLGKHKMGTCSSMPVLLVAVGRRLGYPLKLVCGKGHLFCRWEDGNVRRNFECTNGIACFPDSHYQKWPFPVTDEEVKAGWYLHSLSPREELAAFLALRGQVLSFHGSTIEALLAHAQANLLNPGHPDYKMGLAIASRRQSAELMGAESVEAPMVYRHRNDDPLAEVQAINELNARNLRSRQSTPNAGFPPSTSPFGRFPR